MNSLPNTITITGDLHVHPHIMPRIKEMMEKKLSWKSIRLHGLSIEETLCLHYFAKHPDSYYFLAGLDVSDWHSIQNEYIAFQCTMPNNPQMLRVLHNAIDAMCESYEYSDRATFNFEKGNLSQGVAKA